MSFLLLPSTRVAIYEAIAKKIKILPVKAEELVRLGQGQEERVVFAYQKAISIHSAQELRSGNSNSSFAPLATSTFNKKLEGLTHNNKDLIFVSDKFGDIYSVNLNGQAKYLNSNLGIPTFLEHLSLNGKFYIAVGDEDTRIKIYNQTRMHEIKAFWFLTKRVPLQIVHASDEKLLILIKKQEVNFSNEQNREKFVEVYELETKDIEDSEFQGTQLYLSPEIEQNQECKYQTLITEYNSKAYLLKLFSKKIKIITFALLEKAYKLQSTHELEITEGEWDSIYGSVSTHQNQHELAIVYGKSQQQQDLEQNTHFYQKEMLSYENGWKCSFNYNEHLIVYKL